MSAKPFLALGGLAVVLVGTLFLEYHVAHSEDATLPPASHRLPAVQTGVTQMAPSRTASRVETVLGRPLFRVTRRAPSVDTATGGAASPGLPRLTAVLVSPTGRSVIFASGAAGKPVVVAEGGRIGNYIVQSIGIGQVTVLGPDGVRAIRPAFGRREPGDLVQTLTVGVPATATEPSILDRLRNGPPPSVGIPGLLPVGASALPPGATR